MSWTFESSTGRLYAASEEGMTLVGTGYAGGGLDAANLEAAAGKNNPALQSVHFVGPLPEGWYTLEAPVNSRVVGEYALALVPDAENEMFGRDAFFLHGDSRTTPGWASDGCIIQDRSVRERVWDSGDHRLQVTAKV
jgi:hypothetical protein